jgi:hypothetical protein
MQRNLRVQRVRQQATVRAKNGYTSFVTRGFNTQHKHRFYLTGCL